VSINFNELDGLIEQFSLDRDWDQFHTPKNLLIALIAEMGELSEVVLWKSDQDLEKYLLSGDGKEKISEEIADVAIYLIRLCQKLDINFLKIIETKMDKNSAKYPVDKSKGNSKKYTELDK
jgi:NTP pyrophosphatase (non-canonical NTP hydrolase)